MGVGGKRKEPKMVFFHQRSWSGSDIYISYKPCDIFSSNTMHFFHGRARQVSSRIHYQHRMCRQVLLYLLKVGQAFRVIFKQTIESSQEGGRDSMNENYSTKTKTELCKHPTEPKTSHTQGKQSR